jgi:hypothetical protein
MVERDEMETKKKLSELTGMRELSVFEVRWERDQ